MMITGGGGYDPDGVVRSWAVALAAATGQSELAAHLHDDYELVPPGDPRREEEALAVIAEAARRWDVHSSSRAAEIERVWVKDSHAS